MRILIATGLYPPETGGPATYTKLLEERLPARGFTVRVLPFREVRHLLKFLRHAAYFFKCLRMARGVDVVYAQDTVSVGLPAALAAFFAGKKFLLRVPGDYAWEQARQRFGVTDELDAFQTKRYGLRVGVLRVAQKFVVKRAEKVIVPSGYMQKVVSGWGVKPTLIYNGIDVPPKFELPNDRPKGFLIVTIARPVPWKGLESLKKVVSREPSWTLKIVDGLPHAQAMGWVRTADVFVLNSSYEGLSHALIEAMALGTPVIATRVGGNPEVLSHGLGEGLLINPGDDEGLYAAITNVERHKDSALSRSQAAVKRAEEFSIQKTLGQLVTLFHTL